MSVLRLAELTDEAVVRLPNNQELRYHDEEWVKLDGPTEGPACQMPALMDGEGLMFRTRDGNKWLFTPPDNIERMPEVIYSGSFTIR